MAKKEPSRRALRAQAPTDAVPPREHHRRCARPATPLSPVPGEHRVRRSDGREHADRLATWLRNERSAGQARHHAPPCVLVHTLRRDDEHPADPPVRVPVPDVRKGLRLDPPIPPVPHELGDEALFKTRVLRRAVDRMAHHRRDPGPAPRVDDELPVVRGPENAIDRTRGNSSSERYRSFRSETSMRVAISPPAIRVRSRRYRTSSSSNPPLHGTPSTSRPSGHGVYRIPCGRGGASRSSARASARSLPRPTADTERATAPSP